MAQGRGGRGGSIDPVTCDLWRLTPRLFEPAEVCLLGSPGRCIMSPRAADIPELGFQVGDHVCAFYSEGGYSQDDIVVDYVSRGRRGGEKAVCMIARGSWVGAGIPGGLVPGDVFLKFFTGDGGY